ncbi:MAG: tetratricopeptide repeat protein, partial [Planctomycetota bacterium]|nr:tetratricopeptide repeat protein [Planctomycetota bacterium]
AAAQVSSEVPSNFWRTDSISKFQRALQELEDGLMVNNDRAATHLTLGSIYENLGQNDKAEQAYRLAIQVEPNATGPRSNLAELYTRLAENITRQSQQNPQQAPPNIQETIQNYLQEAEILRREEFVNFERDASYAPENAAVQYRYGLALYRNGQLEDAVNILRKVHELEPRTPIYMIALSRLLQTTEQYEEALKIAEKLIKIEPQHQGLVEELMRQIEQQAPQDDSSKG